MTSGTIPTGCAGGLLCSKYPEAVAKSLEMVEKDVVGPVRTELAMPIADGIYIGAVMMEPRHARAHRRQRQEE